MSAKRPASAVLRSPVVTVEPTPLGSAEQRILAEAVAEYAPLWTVELLGICVEDATLAVVPESGDDMAGPSFVVSRETLGYRLDQVHWDRITEIGQYTALADVVPVILHRIRLCVPRMMPANITVH